MSVAALSSIEIGLESAARGFSWRDVPKLRLVPKLPPLPCTHARFEDALDRAFFLEPPPRPRRLSFEERLDRAFFLERRRG